MALDAGSITFSRGLRDVDANLVLLCRECHRGDTGEVEAIIPPSLDPYMHDERTHPPMGIVRYHEQNNQFPG